MRVIIYFKNGEIVQLDFISEITKGDMGRVIFTRHGLHAATWTFYQSTIDRIEIDSIG